MIVSFSGLDGSGKSTHCNDLAQCLETQGYDVIQIHTTTWTLTNRLGRFLQWRRKGTAAKRKEGNLRALALYSRAIMGLLDVSLFHLYAFYQTRIRGRTLVCDRYFYDLLVNLQYLGFSSSAYARLYKLLIKRPDICFILNPSQPIPYFRNPEKPLDYFSTKSTLYQKLLGASDIVVLGGEDLSADRERIRAQVSKLRNRAGR
ncbi:hypothetical protein MYX82_00110 [Acidobacteria bacterium AH-259-D05]|nr:hypothetical protein [Acidobacteria bacterium AH-259-D05]